MCVLDGNELGQCRGNVGTRNAMMNLRGSQRYQSRTRLIEEERGAKDQPIETAPGDEELRLLLGGKVVLFIIRKPSISPCLRHHRDKHQSPNFCDVGGSDRLGQTVVIDCVGGGAIAAVRTGSEDDCGRPVKGVTEIDDCHCRQVTDGRLDAILPPPIVLFIRSDETRDIPVTFQKTLCEQTADRTADTDDEGASVTSFSQFQLP